MAAERKGETEADRQQKPGLEWFMEEGIATEAEHLQRLSLKMKVF